MSAALANLKFHHLGLAVRQDADALALLGAMGYAAGEKIFDPLQNVHVRLCTAEGRPAVEIVQPGAGPGPVDALVSKYSEIVYHTCYETPDLAKTLGDIEALGLRCLCVAERKPALLFGGRHVSFYRIVGFGIVELLEKG